MNQFLTATIAAGALAITAPASATVLVAGSSGQVAQDFSLISATQGTLLASTTVSGQALTFGTTVKSAVYRNTLGTLDFYYQVARTGRGSLSGAGGNQSIDKFTASSFARYMLDAFVSNSDPDGIGFFTSLNNPGAFSTTLGRSSDDAVAQFDFGLNSIDGTRNSATYILRTNATRYAQGTFGVLDGSTFSGLAYAPAAIPEPSTWLMLLSGFGLVGAAVRRRKHSVAA